MQPLVREAAAGVHGARPGMAPAAACVLHRAQLLLRERSAAADSPRASADSFDQEQAFGKQAMAYLPVTECFPDGWRRVRARGGAGEARRASREAGAPAAAAARPPTRWLRGAGACPARPSPPSHNATHTTRPHTPHTRPERQGVEMAPSCAAVPVRAFPTWVFPNGSIVEGERFVLAPPATPAAVPHSAGAPSWWAAACPNQAL